MQDRPARVVGEANVLETDFTLARGKRLRIGGVGNLRRFLLFHD